MLTFNHYFDYENKNLEEFTFNELVKEKESKKIGYYHLPYESMSLLDKLKDVNFTFNKLAIIGIGGSSLGTKAIYRLLKQNYKKYKRDYFFRKH